MTHSDDRKSELAISEARFDELIDQFEDAWSRTVPAIAEFLDLEDSSLSEELLFELVKIDIENRWRAWGKESARQAADGTTIREASAPSRIRYLEEYLIEFPELTSQPTALLELVGEEYRVRQRFGDQPLHKEYMTRYANLDADSLRHIFQNIDRDLALDKKPSASLSVTALDQSVISTVNNSHEGASQMSEIQQQERHPAGSIIQPSQPESFTICDSDDDELTAEFLAHTHPFSELPKGIIQEIANRMTEQEFPAGTDLIRQGDAANNVLVMTEGVAEVSTIDDSAQSHLINRVGSHTVLGEIALLTREPRSATVTATTDVRAFALNVNDFHEIATQFPTLNVIFAELVAERVGTVGLDVLCGKTINGFHIERRLGRGSMGVVYEAIELSNDRRVALKMMSHALIYDYQAVSRFHRETKIVDSLDHPNIIRSFGKFTSLNTFFLVMEFCDGLPLSDVISLSGPLPENQIRALLGQLASALEYTHSQNIVHRDIKPGNVFVQWDGCVKLMDFGLARADENPELTQRGQLLGTPRYMPPEQLAGQTVGQEADLYAMGCIAFELLSGKPMHSGKDALSLMRQQLEWTLPEHSELGDEISGEFYGLLKCSLEKEPELRTVDLQEIAKWATSFDMSELSQQVRWENDNAEPNDEPTIIYPSPMLDNKPDSDAT